MIEAKCRIKLSTGNYFKFSIRYADLRDLSSKIWDFLTLICDLEVYDNLDVKPDGWNYYIHWDSTIAHLCYAEGKMTKENFINEIFGKEA